ncbi:MAG: SMP-30/gluconolactonase/LRE family protein [bacterium]|nr:SMP-30/gluconolactonase/LRE family protein [bacterium]
MLRTLIRLAAAATLAVPLLAITVSRPGTVTTIVDAKLFTAPSGEQHLHGIVRDPITGDMYVGDWNALRVGGTPWFGPYVENQDSLRRINQLQEVSIVSYAVAPNAMTYDTAQHRLYVVVGSTSCSSGAAEPAAGPTLHGILVLDPATGAMHTLAGGNAGTTSGEQPQVRFSGPIGIASDPASGALFVSEACMNRIREVDPTGNAVTLAGTGTKGFADGARVAATFDDPHGVAYCERDRRLYVADTGNNAIRAVALDGTVTTLAGQTKAGFTDATGASAQFDRPTGVACDDAGNVYVADSGNNAVRMIAPDGVVTTIAGNGSSGNVDATGADARFATPGDITYDPVAHALYVIDWSTNNVRKVTLAAATLP